MIILSLIAFLLIFSVLIVVHEWGHFFTAQKCGVKVLEFSLGFGKKIWTKTHKGVEYALALVPFGGFVRMLGEDESSDDPRSFEQAKLWKRMAITLAGIAMNFVFAVVILTGLFSFGTTPVLISDADVDQAIERGIVVLGEELEDGSRQILEIKEIQKPFPQSFVFAVTETWRISGAVIDKAAEIPGEIISTGKLPDGLAGPVGIAEATHKILPSGIAALLKLAALLSISLAVMNLLPIPALDGGRFLFQLIELVIRRRVPPKWENSVHIGGFVLLMVLIAAVTWNDIVRIFF